MNRSFEIGEKLTGSIYKDGQILYEDRIFITSVNKDINQTGEEIVQIDLFDDDEPKVAVNDICRLTLQDGRDIDIKVITVAEAAQQSVLIFSLEPAHENQKQVV